MVLRMWRGCAVAALCAAGVALAATAAHGYEVTAITGFHDPRGIAASPNGRNIFTTQGVQNPSDSNYYLGAIQSAECGNQLDWSVPLSTSAPSNVVFSHNGQDAWILAADELEAVNPETCQVVATLVMPTANVPVRGLAVNARGTRLYAANPDCFGCAAANSVTVVDTETLGVITHATMGSGPPAPDPQGLAVSPDGTEIYVATAGDDRVRSLNAADNSTYTVIAPSATFGAPQAVAFSPDGSRAYVANGANVSGAPRLSVIDTASRSVVAQPSISPGFNSIDVELSPDGSLAYVLNAGSLSVSVVDTATNTLVADIPLPGVSFPQSLAVSASGTHAYVPAATANKVLDVRLGPGAPTGLVSRATGGESTATISFTPGTSNGQSITGYQYSVDGGAWTAAGSASSPVTVSGLTSGRSYQVRLRAINGQAPGDASAAVDVVVPPAPDPTPDPSPSPSPAASVRAGSTSVKVTSRRVELRSRVTVSGAGLVTQVATQGSGRKAVRRCRAVRSSRAAGSYSLTCAIGSSGRRALRRSSMKLSVTTAFAPSNGAQVTTSRSLTLKRRR